MDIKYRSMWKTKWDSVVNNDEFRRKYLGNPGSEYSEIQMTKEGAQGIPSEFGTILMKGSRGEDHFGAYRGTEIFDPAGNKYSYFSRVKYSKLIRETFPGYTILDWHPQKREGDTFCQTWSLYWLKNHEMSTESLFEICKDISSSRAFSKLVSTVDQDFLKEGLTADNIEEILKG